MQWVQGEQGAESLRIQMYQVFLGLLGQKIWILSAKRIWGSLDLEQKSSADEQQPYKSTASEETAIE